MPSAMSRPSEPVEMASTSTAFSFWPSRMMEPLPKPRSIWEIAASRAFSSIHLISFDEAQRGIRHGKVSVISQGSSESQFRGSARTLAREVHSAFASAWVAGEVRAELKKLYTFCSLFAICSFRRRSQESEEAAPTSGLAFLVCCCARVTSASSGRTSSPAAAGTPMSVQARIPGLPFGSPPLRRARSFAPWRGGPKFRLRWLPRHRKHRRAA